MTNPYRGLPDHCFWNRAMSWPAPGRIDPVVSGIQLGLDDKVSTMGSCFAQHLARHIKTLGLNYHVTERAPDWMTPDQASASNYDVFSARYGNVYTVRQALQMFYRAFGIFHPGGDIWARGDGFVDAFRPQIEPVPFASVDEVQESRRLHLGYVRDVFTQSSWIVFTLGLTEAWQSRHDGSIYPVAPGVSGGDYNTNDYAFVNFGFNDVAGDLRELIRRIGDVNPGCKILLTVSPVPLIATYEPQHVLVSTTYSKAVLRAVAGEIANAARNVHYFPSYEIITSPASGGGYYEDDLRQVTDLGVRHVMRLFTEHYVNKPICEEPEQMPARTERPVEAEPPRYPNAVVCDEEAIERSLKEHGFVPQTP